MDITEYRKFFPITENYTYLDNSGVGPVSTVVKQKVDEFLDDALHHATFVYDSWMEQVEEARAMCAELVGCEPEEIAFVRSTSHGISIVASGYPWKEGDNIVIYEKEFPSNLYPWLNLESKGVEVRRVQPDNKGYLNREEIIKKVDSNTRLVSVSSVQFTNGYRVDTTELGQYCRDNGILLFTDCIQSLGAIPFDVKRDNIDFTAADGHKWLLSPEGTGIFYCRKDIAPLIEPPLLGWKSVVEEGSYEKIDFNLKKNALRFEEGSMNVMGILALGASCKMLLDAGIDNIKDRVYYLGDLVIENSKKRGFEITSPAEYAHRAGIVCFRGDFDPESVRDQLVETGIMVNVRGGSIRVSPHFYNNEEDINNLFKGIDKILEKSGR